MSEVDPEIIEQGIEETERLKSETNSGGPITCFFCGLPTEMKKDGRHWSAKCTCGWSAAGSLPEQKH